VRPIGWLALVAAAACSRAPGPVAAPPAPPNLTATAAAPAPAPAPPVDEPPDDDGAGDAPRETVKIQLVADARRKAEVFWGRKDLGTAPLEITRPKDSGPLDLVVTAPGCLPLHTRVFTDRDAKIPLRLYAESEAPSLIGYRAEDRVSGKP
jgi:hypothetical protein